MQEANTGSICHRSSKQNGVAISERTRSCCYKACRAIYINVVSRTQCKWNGCCCKPCRALKIAKRWAPTNPPLSCGYVRKQPTSIRHLTAQGDTCAGELRKIPREVDLSRAVEILIFGVSNDGRQVGISRLDHARELASWGETRFQIINRLRQEDLCYGRLANHVKIIVLEVPALRKQLRPNARRPNVHSNVTTRELRHCDKSKTAVIYEDHIRCPRNL